jgi:hypothetical protein
MAISGRVRTRLVELVEAQRGVRAVHARAEVDEALQSARELLASPSELLASPSKLLASPSELSASPSESS